MKKKPYIYIKPSKKGTLRKAVKAKKGKKIPVTVLEKAKKSKSPALRKKANFALNARKFNHTGNRTSKSMRRILD